MHVSDLTSRQAVLETIAEFDALGQEAFLRRYGYGRALGLLVKHEGRLYDSKAIAGVALGYQYGPGARLSGHNYTGGKATAVRALERLGFEVIDTRAALSQNSGLRDLDVGRTYAWNELGAFFRCKPNFFSIAGGMLSRPEFDALLLITHPGGAQSFDYDDYWEGDQLIYTGKGQTGHQKMEGENRHVAENRRTLYVFEHAGRRRLTFLGVARCADWKPDTSLDRNKDPRRIFRFRLDFGRSQRPSSPGTTRARQDRRPPRTGVDAAAARTARAFDPGRSLSAYRAPAQNQSPEETAAQQEKAARGHHAILVHLNDALTDAGWTEIEEIQAAFDLRAKHPDSTGPRVLFEAKTLGGTNESHQVRSGLAQLLEYRFLYGEPIDELCLVCNAPIRDERIRLLRALGIDFAWLEGDRLLSRGAPKSADLGSLFDGSDH